MIISPTREPCHLPALQPTIAGHGLASLERISLAADRHVETWNVYPSPLADALYIKIDLRSIASSVSAHSISIRLSNLFELRRGKLHVALVNAIPPVRVARRDPLIVKARQHRNVHFDESFTSLEHDRVQLATIIVAASLGAVGGWMATPTLRTASVG